MRVNKLLRNSVLAAFIGAGIGVAQAADDASTNLSGRIYWDFSDKTIKKDGVNQPGSGYGFDVTRFYLGVDHKFDDTWLLDLTTDFSYDSAHGKTDLFVKKAFIEGNFDPLFKLRLGSADMPWIPYVEDAYGFRYVEKTIIDRFGFGNSADWGAHAQGKQGIFDYQLSAVNGAGFSNVSGRSKRIDYEARLGLHPLEGMILAAGLYNGKLGQSQEGTNAPHTNTRYDALLAYVGHGARAGFEYFQSKNPKAANITGTEDKADGYSVFASYEVYKPVTVFGRYDWTKLSKDVDPSKKDTYFNVGAEYAVRKGVRFSLVYKWDRVKSDTTQTKTDEIGLFSEVRF